MKLPSATSSAFQNFPPESRGETAARLLRGNLLFLVIVASWLMSLAGVWFLDGLLVWTAGLLYITYDTGLLLYVAWQTRSLRRLPPRWPPERSPTIAVLVAARNERAALPACIRSLQSQSITLHRIFIVDDGSTDDTLAVLRKEFGLVDHQNPRTAAAGNLEVLAKAHGGKARALNEGLQHLDADIVVTIDADTVMAPDAIAAMRDAFARNTKLVAACGVLRPRASGSWLAAVFEWFQTFEYLRAFLSRAAWMRADALLLVSGAFAGFRRDALITVGGFDARSRVEDYELIHRLHRHSHEHGLGWEVQVVNEAYAETDVPGDLPTFLRQRRRWFAGFLETLYANRDMAGSTRYGSLGRLMLPVKIVDTLQPVFGITAFALLVYFIVARPHVLPFVFTAIGVKLVIDIAYHLWSVHLYHRWIGRPVTGRTWLLALAASCAEPFSFQLLRHLGAVLGWLSLMQRRNDWVPLAAEPHADAMPTLKPQ